MPQCQSCLNASLLGIGNEVSHCAIFHSSIAYMVCTMRQWGNGATNQIIQDSTWHAVTSDTSCLYVTGFTGYGCSACSLGSRSTWHKTKWIDRRSAAEPNLAAQQTDWSVLAHLKHRMCDCIIMWLHHHVIASQPSSCDCLSTIPMNAK